jgi:hypothetical protein
MKLTKKRTALVTFSLSSYMEYFESIGFTPKILIQSCFLPIKSHKTEKTAIIYFSVCHVPSPQLTEIFAPPTAIRPKELKFWLPESFRPT